VRLWGIASPQSFRTERGTAWPQIALRLAWRLGVGAWCTLCLITAAAMLIMIAPAVDEVVALSFALANIQVDVDTAVRERRRRRTSRQ
jgi:hypothetical protein